MVDLSAKSPCGALLPLKVGDLTLREAGPAHLTSIAPFKGKQKACSEALKKAHGVALPAIGRSTAKAGLRVIWSGRGQYFLSGSKPAAKPIARHAALTDQSDAWAVLELEGPEAAEVLARLCPLDLRETEFKRGDSARSEVAHMMAVVTRLPKGFEILVMRSFARTVVQALQGAMESVAAQRHLN